MPSYYIPLTFEGIERRLGPFDSEEILEWINESEPTSSVFHIAIPLNEVVVLTNGQSVWLADKLITPETTFLGEDGVSILFGEIPEFKDVFGAIGEEISISELGEVPHFVKLLPSLNQVFANPTQKIKEHCYPLFSVHLSRINPAWDVWLHVVDFFVDGDEPIADKSVLINHKGWDPQREMVYILNENGLYEMEYGLVQLNVTKQWEKWLFKAQQQYQMLVENFELYRVFAPFRLDSDQQAAQHGRKRLLAQQFGAKTGEYCEWAVDGLSGSTHLTQHNDSPVHFILEFEVGNTINYLFYQPDCKRVIHKREFT